MEDWGSSVAAWLWGNLRLRLLVDAGSGCGLVKLLTSAATEAVKQHQR